MERKSAVPGPDRNGGWLPAFCILLLTVVLSLLWSHARLMWNDEFLSFYSDSVPTFADVLRVQLHTPISLDPPTYHLLSHLSMDAIGRGATALRLPALAGFLLLQVCLFALVRRLAGVRCALLAMVLPLCTASFRYAVEGRPYGWLLGLYALSLLCWYSAAQRGDAGLPRPVPLVGLAAAIALAVTSHYFGVLILIPVTAGELARTYARRRLDWGSAAALAVGLASVALILPFKRALLPYQRHYYIQGVNLHNVSQGYRELFLRYTTWPIATQRATALAMAVATLLLLWAAVRRSRDRPVGEPAWLWTALSAFALLPFFGYLFGRFVTHTMEVRYVIAALIAFVVVAALLLEKSMRSTQKFSTAMAVALLFAVVVCTLQIRGEQRNSRAILASLRENHALQAALDSTPTPATPLYTQSLNDLFLNSYYAGSADVRSRITLLYSQDAELRWFGHDTNAVTAMYLQRLSALKVAPYGDLLHDPADPLLLYYGSGWEWIGKDLRSRGIAANDLGPAQGGELYRVQISPEHRYEGAR